MNLSPPAKLARTDLPGQLAVADATAAGLAMLSAEDAAAQRTLLGVSPTVAAPAAADSAGVAGSIAYESGFLYVCVATDTWERVAIATWP